MVDINQTTSYTLNVDGLNKPIKRHNQRGSGKKQNTQLNEIYFKYKSTYRLK